MFVVLSFSYLNAYTLDTVHALGRGITCLARLIKHVRRGLRSTRYACMHACITRMLPELN
jgi:hypothetical protein